jgi:hypothetical protein
MSLQTRHFVEMGRMFYCNSVLQISNCTAIWVCEISEQYMSSATASFISFSKATTSLVTNISHTSGQRYKAEYRIRPAIASRLPDAPLLLHYAMTDGSLNCVQTMNCNIMKRTAVANFKILFTSFHGRFLYIKLTNEGLIMTIIIFEDTQSRELSSAGMDF